jgi:hypothetical protein
VKAMTQIFRLHCFLLTTATADRWSRDQRVIKGKNGGILAQTQKHYLYNFTKNKNKNKIEKNLFFILMMGNFFF